MATSEAPLWQKRLSRLQSFHHVEIPYVPLPIEDVVSYTQQEDYEKRIKKIETIGILEPIDFESALLISTKADSPCTLKLALGLLQPNYAFVTEINSFRRGLRHAWETVRVLGTLKILGQEIILLVEMIVRVRNPAKCEQILATMTRISRTAYSLFDYDSRSNGQLNYHIEKMKDSNYVKLWIPKRVRHQKNKKNHK